MEFKKLPRVYTYGNNVAVYSSADSNAEQYDRVDIYGEKFSADGKDVSSSHSSMILVDSSLPYVKVTADNFLKWVLPGRKYGFMKKEEAIFSPIEYEEYKSIYKELKGSRDLLNLTNHQRVLIRQIIKSTASLNGAVVADDYPPDKEKTGYSKVLPTSVIDGSAYIFLRLKTAGGNKNFVINYTGQIFSITELTDNGMEPIRNPGFFKEQKLASSSPDILFYDITNSREKKSVLPPYQLFN
jgi:hypothetical protein